jgi:signal transduction histidine kinase
MQDNGDQAAGRCRLADLLGDELLGRILRARGIVTFVLDASGAVARIDPAAAALLDPGAPLAVGAPLRCDRMVPAGRVADLIAAGLAGNAPEPTLVAIREHGEEVSIWQLDVYPVKSPALAGSSGVLGVLARVGAHGESYVLDPTLFSVTLSERLERERLETTQALIVTMRHEINNALTSVIGNGDLILRHAERYDAVVATRVREIVHQAHRIRSVLEKLEGLTHVRTTTYLDGVRMVSLDGEPDGTPEPGVGH